MSSNRGKMFAAACLLCAGVAFAQSLTVLWDHTVNVQEVGIVDHFWDNDPAWRAVGAAPILGNGEFLRTVTIYWAHGALDGTPNGGDVSKVRYRLLVFYSQPTDMLGIGTTPDVSLVFDEPSNPDWQTPVGGFLGFDLLRSEIDVSAAHVKTQKGVTYWVALVPETGEEIPSVITALSYSKWGTGAVGAESDWYQTGANYGAEGPASLVALGRNEKFLAYKVTSFLHPLDWDEDDDIDITEVNFMAGCATGPAIAIAPGRIAECGKADIDQDGDIDQSDFGLLQRCISGAGISPEPDCI